MENLPVVINLSVGQVNRLLNLLGTHPYNVSADIIHVIKSQGDAQVAAAQEKARMPSPPLPAVDAAAAAAAVDTGEKPANAH